MLRPAITFTGAALFQGLGCWEPLFAWTAIPPDMGFATSANPTDSDTDMSVHFCLWFGGTHSFLRSSALAPSHKTKLRWREAGTGQTAQHNNKLKNSDYP